MSISKATAMPPRSLVEAPRPPEDRPAVGPTPQVQPETSPSAGHPSPERTLAAPEVQRSARRRAVAQGQAPLQAQLASASAPVIVKAGDTLSSIARRYETPAGKPGRWQDLVAHNPPFAKNPDLIYPGQQVQVPPGWRLRAAPASDTDLPARNPPPAPRATTDAPPAPRATTDAPPAPRATTDAPPAPRATTDAPPAPRATTEARPAPRATADVPPTPPVVAGRTAAQDAWFQRITALGPATPRAGNSYEQRIWENQTAADLQRFVDGALATLERRQGDFTAESSWTRNIRVALGRAAELGVTLR